MTPGAPRPQVASGQRGCHHGDMTTLPYGAWPSPITAASLVEGTSAVGEIRVDGDDVWWNESRPAEKGRTVLVRRSPDGNTHQLFLPLGHGEVDWNVRTALGEYGGGAWAVRQGTVVFAHWADQRLYKVTVGAMPSPITPAPTVPREWRYAEPVWLDDDWLVCVRECHTPSVKAEHGEAVSELVALPTDGSAATDPDQVRVLFTGPDFIQSPVVDGDEIAFLQWWHPQMPWDGTEVVVGVVGRDTDRAPDRLVDTRVVMGSVHESVVQPGFTSDGDLLAISDRTGWWNPWVLTADGEYREHGRDLVKFYEGRPLAKGVGVEMAGPMWVGGLRWWAELDDGRFAFVVTAEGRQSIGLVDGAGKLALLDCPFTEISQLVAQGSNLLVVASTPTAGAAPYRVRAESSAGDGPQCRVDRLRALDPSPVGQEWFSTAEHFTFTSAGDRTAHALYYAPHHPEVSGPEGTTPPLVVMIHGGPTSAARNRLSLAKQYWTTRGFAVVDVDYGGSTGYGRAYRELLKNNWGVVDVEDAVAAARHLADIGRADVDKLAIRGGSAGGFTTLAALCFHDVFGAGCSMFGVADLAALAADTHKFESRYLDGLVGPYPEAEAVYAERSPINHVDGFRAPLIVQQGSEDEVVPPNQAEMIVEALAVKGVPHAYQLFEGEGHGFRQAETIVRALESELWFYRKVFGLADPDGIAPVEGAVGLNN